MKNAAVLFLFIIGLFLSCGDLKNTQNDLVELENAGLIEAQTLRNEGQYTEACSAFLSIPVDELSDQEIAFRKLNLELCRLLEDENYTSDIQTETDSTFHPLNQLIGAISNINQGNADFTTLYRVRNDLERRNLSSSFYYLLTVEQLGLTHRRVASRIDSANFYFKQANQFARKNEMYRNNLPRILYHLADVCLAERDQITGLAYVAEALTFPISDRMKGILLVAKGSMLRKQKQYQESLHVYLEAERLLKGSPNKKEYIKALREHTLQTIMEEDTVAFYSYMKKIHEVAGTIHLQQYQEHRLWGYYFLLRKDHQQTIFHYQKAVDNLMQNKWPESVLFMEALYILTEVNQKLGRYKKAEESAYQALVALTPYKNIPYTWENVLRPEIMSEPYNFINYDLLAGVLLERYKYEKPNDGLLSKAMRLYHIIDSLMIQQVQAMEEEAVLQFLRAGHEIYSKGIEVCWLKYQNSKDESFLELAHYYMERSKSLVIYRDMLTHDDDYFPEVPLPFRNRELQLKRDLAALKNRNDRSSDEFREAVRSFQTYIEEMKLTYPEYYAAKHNFSIPSFKDLKKNISNDMSVLQFHMSNEYLYLLRYDEPKQFLQISLDSTLTSAIISLRQSISNPSSITDSSQVRRFFKHSHKIYDHVFKKVGDLKQDVLIVPDGSLNSLPIEILVNDPSGNHKTARYFLKSHYISYAHSIKTAELHTDHVDGPFRKVLGFAYSSEGEANVVSQRPSLKGASTELKTIESLFSSTQLYYGKQASRNSFLSEMEDSYDVIHLGLHAISSSNDRLENKIFFRSGTSIDDVVYGYEIIPKKINANLVVITACESAFGANVQGEGTYSLLRAFSQSGVEHVIGSLWSLPDQSSSRIIGEFYSGLISGKSPGTALNDAKRKYLESADQFTAAPYFWAGLVSYGH